MSVFLSVLCGMSLVFFTACGSSKRASPSVQEVPQPSSFPPNQDGKKREEKNTDEKKSVEVQPPLEEMLLTSPPEIYQRILFLPPQSRAPEESELPEGTFAIQIHVGKKEVSIFYLQEGEVKEFHRHWNGQIQPLSLTAFLTQIKKKSAKQTIENPQWAQGLFSACLRLPEAEPKIAVERDSEIELEEAPEGENPSSSEPFSEKDESVES